MMIKKKRILFLFMMTLPVMTVFSQSSDLGNWLLYFGNKSINEKWNLHNEIQYRNYNAIGDLEQLLLRTGLGYNLTENNNNILLGFGYILSENYLPNSDDKVKINEYRLFQQYITRQSIERVKVQHRYRFEQRWIEENFKMRFRYFLALNIPINNKELLDKTLYLSMYNEIFLNSKDVIFDRNRLYTGLGYKVNKTVRFEFGYMNQFFANSNRDQINVIAFVNF